MNNPILPTPTNNESPTPPSGFKLEYVCSCGSGCTPDERLDDACQIEGWAYEGPSAHLKSNPSIRLDTTWTPENGIAYRFSNYYPVNEGDNVKWVMKPLRQEEAEELPILIAHILERTESE